VPAPASLPLSILILTLNEEHRLPGCLRSVAGCEDVVVLDSGSTDGTEAIARAAGARFFTHPFENFAAQRNHAQDGIAFRHPWVFHLDADETMTEALAAECAGLPPDDPCDGYYAAPRMMYHGRWMRRCTDYPAWQARCIRAGRFRFVQTGHGQREAPTMRMGFLQHGYLHDISVPDENDWEAKHRRYARDEARRYLAEQRPPAQSWRALLTGPALERRRSLKHLSYSLPCRPALRFFYQFFLRAGFLDGPSALGYCRRLARYERFATEEIRRQSAAQP